MSVEKQFQETGSTENNLKILKELFESHKGKGITLNGWTIELNPAVAKDHTIDNQTFMKNLKDEGVVFGKATKPENLMLIPITIDPNLQKKQAAEQEQFKKESSSRKEEKPEELKNNLNTPPRRNGHKRTPSIASSNQSTFLTTKEELSELKKQEEHRLQMLRDEQQMQQHDDISSQIEEAGQRIAELKPFINEGTALSSKKGILEQKKENLQRGLTPENLIKVNDELSKNNIRFILERRTEKNIFLSGRMTAIIPSGSYNASIKETLQNFGTYGSITHTALGKTIITITEVSDVTGRFWELNNKKTEKKEPNQLNRSTSLHEGEFQTLSETGFVDSPLNFLIVLPEKASSKEELLKKRENSVGISSCLFNKPKEHVIKTTIEKQSNFRQHCPSIDLNRTFTDYAKASEYSMYK